MPAHLDHVDTLLVASTGGHLNELLRLAPRLLASGERALWVTNNSIQSRSLFQGERPVFVPYHGSRNLPLTARNAVTAVRLLRRHQPSRVISTGSGIAVSFLAPARALGVEAHYIESGTRVTSPSLTGRILERVPGTRCYAQYPDWTRPGWAFGGSILDGFESRPLDRVPEVRRVVVALGSWRQSFRRLVERLVDLLPSETEVLWQTGHTPVDDLRITATPWVPPTDLAGAMHAADLVVTHAGMGASLDALEAGRLPLVVPRRVVHGEQIDDHQVQLARELDRRGLAVVRLPEELTRADLAAAASRRVTSPARLPPFRLV